MKTGFTEAAGRCLVASATRREKTVLAVILGSTMEDVWDDAEARQAFAELGVVLEGEVFKPAVVEVRMLDERLNHKRTLDVEMARARRCRE